MTFNRLLLPLLIGLFFLGCKKEKTSWDSDYKLILVNDTLRINNLSKDSLFAADADSNLMLSFEKELLNFNFFDKVKIPDTTIHQKYALGVNSLEAAPGFSIVNQADDYYFDIKDVKLTNVTVKSGKIDFEVRNIFPTKVKLVIKFPKATLHHQSLQKIVEVEAGSKSSPTRKKATIDISGYNLDLRGKDNDYFNSLSSNIQLITDPNGKTVTVTKNDSTLIDIAFSNITLYGARGYFGQISSNETFDTSIPFFNNLSDLINIGAYNFDLILKNSCKVEGNLKVSEIKSTNIHTNNSVSLQHESIGNTIFMQAATGDWQQHTAFERTLHFSSINSNVDQIISNLGSRYSGNIFFQLNPYGNTNVGWNELFSDSKISVTMKANMPLTVGMSNLVFKDTFDFNVNNSIDKTHLKKGNLLLNISNAYPIDLLATIQLLDANGQSIGTVSVSDRILSSVEGASFQNGLRYSVSNVQLELSEEICTRLSEVKSIVVLLKSNTHSSQNVPPATPVKIPYNGFIGIKLFGDFGINFKL